MATAGHGMPIFPTSGQIVLSAGHSLCIAGTDTVPTALATVYASRAPTPCQQRLQWWLCMHAEDANTRRHAAVHWNIWNVANDQSLASHQTRVQTETHLQRFRSSAHRTQHTVDQPLASAKTTRSCRCTPTPQCRQVQATKAARAQLHTMQL